MLVLYSGTIYMYSFCWHFYLKWLAFNKRHNMLGQTYAENLNPWATTLEYFAVALSKTYSILSLLYLINTHTCVQVRVGCVRFSRQVSSAFPSAAGDWGGEYWQAEGSHTTLGTVPHQRPEPKLAVHLPPGTQGCSRSCRWRTVTKLELHGYNRLYSQ